MKNLGTWVITACLALTIAACGGGASPPAPVATPNVVGGTQAAATLAITAAGLTLGTVTMQASSSVAAGNVISESPAAGTQVAAKSAVSLTISSGPASISVPNVVGETQSTATSAITGAGLTLGKITETSSTSLPVGSVVTESPAAGSAVAAGTAVNLVVSALPFTAISATMTSARAGHTATLLADGKVLVAGGCSVIPCSDLNTAELYDPSAQTFTALSAQMTTGRFGATATLLPSGKVLIAGGAANAGNQANGGGAVFSTAELYDPVANTFTPTAAMTVARFGHTATLLPNGTVLIAGGFSDESSSNPAIPVTWNTAEVYDPVADTFTAITPTMTVGRATHAATLLPNGTVLITGGQCEAPNTGVASSCDPALPPFASTYFNTAEVYDPKANTFTSLGATMTSIRIAHTENLLANGQVLITGGSTGGVGSPALNTAELYNPSTGAFTALTATMTTPRFDHAGTVLPNGQVLLSGGGINSTATITNTVEVYAP